MPTTVSEQEGRRIQRIALPLPTRVDVRVDATLAWNEVTRLTDVSPFGAGFTLKRPAKRGRLVLLTIPMPRQLRCYDFSENQYKVWGLVRRCIQANAGGEEKYMVGVAFIGRKPPQSFLDDPSTLYEISHREEKGLWSIESYDSAADESGLSRDARKQTRFFIPEPLQLELLDENGAVCGSESTVTENLSHGGASVFTSMEIRRGTIVRVTSEQHNVSIISIVRACRVGEDRIRRLHLEFIDRYFPLSGLE